MRLAGTRLLALSFLSGLSVVVACATDSVNIPDAPQILPDGGVPNDGTTPQVDASDDVEAAVDASCPTVAPDDTVGIYVSDTTGANDALCGTRDKPCKTITFGIGRAVTVVKKRVYVAQGTYAEHISLKAGITVEGGWAINGTAWSRVCVSPSEATIVRAPAAEKSTVDATDLGGVAALSTLHLQSKVQASIAKSDSVYGLIATGATTNVSLTDVIITVGNGGAGTDGTAGGAGTAGAANCAAGAGTVGTAGTIGTGAPAGSFDATGWVATSGTMGGPGGAGDNGTAGGVHPACADCKTCGDFAGGCIPIDAPDNCGTDGTPGCAGGGGGAGGLATGGGSSVGIFSWDATVQVTGGRVKVGDGGDGGAGGAGGTAGVPTAGKAGTNSAACTTACTLGAVACTETKTATGGGTPGGTGGAGGAGGVGGGGSGGSSIAIYQGGAGVVAASSSTTLAIGKAGKGGGPVTAAGAAGLAVLKVP